MDVLILLGLILLNGLFAMSEIALVSAKKVRLEQAAAAGDRGAATALQLQFQSTRLLSTVQVGISLITLAQGAYGDSTFSGPLQSWLEQFTLIAPYAKETSVAIVLLGISIVSIIFGELVPKRIGILYPERIAKVVSRPMKLVEKIASPVVKLLSTSTDFLLRPFGKPEIDDAQVTEEDIKGLIRQGANAGVFEADESKIVQRVFNLDDYTVDRIMTPRADMVYIDVNAEQSAIEELLKESTFTVYPVVRDDVSNVIGVIDSGDLLAHQLKSGKLMPERVRKDAHFVPETVTVLEVLATFKRTQASMAFVVDEHGEVLGLVTLKDVLETIVGDLGDEDEPANSDATKRADGSWLIDGAATLDRFREIFPAAPAFPGEADERYRTLGGFVMAELGRIAQVGDHASLQAYRFEVVDMDGKRVDKLLVTPPHEESGI
ncbi:MAG: HlyC/CorC family transporter [Burkholderiales bacterium]|nr:MAG: HlyC/CorC family transporter [Burkholderiales bacterium]